MNSELPQLVDEAVKRYYRSKLGHALLNFGLDLLRPPLTFEKFELRPSVGSK